MSVEIRNNNTDKWKSEFNTALIRALMTVGIQCRRNTMDNFDRYTWKAPTGNLKRHIEYQVEPSEKAVYVGTNVEYAVYVEMGTGRRGGWSQDIEGMEARPYLKPAVTEHLDEYRNIIKTELGG